MNESKLLLRISVDKDSLLGRVADIEKKADALRFEAMRLREAISGCHDADEERPEA